MSMKTPKTGAQADPKKQNSTPKVKPAKPDQDDVAEKARGNESLPGKIRDPESDGMEFPDGTGRKRQGDLGTGD